jgi:hypothetical protein
MSNAALLDVERERDDIVRTFACPLPNCRAEPLKPCQFGLSATGHRMWSHTSHEARYNLAAEAGLAPRLPGVRDG